MRRVKLLLVNQYYPPDSAPTGHYLHQLARTLVARGHDVTVLCSRRAYNGDAVYPAEEQIDGVHVERVRAAGFGRKSGFGKLCDYGTFWASLTARLFAPSRKPDLILALTTPPYVGLLVALAARWKGCVHAHWIMDIYPDVLAAHGSLSPDSLVFRCLAASTRAELKGAPLVACLGDDMAQRLKAYVPMEAQNAIRSIPLWSDPTLVPWDEPTPLPFRMEQGWATDDLVLMYSGNMGRGHRMAEFLQAAAALRSDRSVQWVFAGGGKRRGEIEEALRADPVLNVRLLPYAPSERLREHLCSADVHLVSLDSSWQGCMVPSKFQGIFAVAKPVLFVGRRENSLAQWIEASGGGWVVPENDVPALLTAVNEARDPAERRRRGAAARRFAEEHFDARHNLTRLADLLEHP